MENKEELLKELENLPEEEKAKIRNLKKLDKKSLEAAVGGLGSSTKVALIGLGVLAALGGVATVAYKVGKQAGIFPDSIEKLRQDFQALSPYDGVRTSDERMKKYKDQLPSLISRAKALFPDKKIETEKDLKKILFIQLA